MLIMINRMAVPICKCFYSRQANSDKITFLEGECTRFNPYVRGEAFNPMAQNIVSKILDHYGSLLWKLFAPFWYGCRVWQTDTLTDSQTDAYTIAKTREALHAVVRKKNKTRE